MREAAQLTAKQHGRRKQAAWAVWRPGRVMKRKIFEKNKTESITYQIL
jgi:hypothetical protein